MFKKLIEKLNKKLKERKGASMAVVIVTMSLLVILGSSFAMIAFNSYTQSYGEMCRQQATYTAKGVLDSFVKNFKADPNLRTKVSNSIRTVVNTADAGADITKLKANIKISGLDSMLADKVENADGSTTTNCTMTAMYNIIKKEHDNTVTDEFDKSRVRVIVTARYKGFEKSLGVMLANTSKASIELRKIMDNCLYFTDPIVNYVYKVKKENVIPAIQGDVYIDAPLWYDEKNNPYEKVETKSVKKGSSETLTGHTLQINNEGKSVNTPNHWSEVYMRSQFGGSADSYDKLPVTITGNLKCNTDVLLGLHNRGVDEPNSHGYGEKVEVSFDFDDGTNLIDGNKDHRRPAENCLVVGQDIYAKGDVRAENLVCKGSLYAIKTKGDDGKYSDKGNVYLQVEKETLTAILGLSLKKRCTFMHIEKDVVADGYVAVVGYNAYLSDPKAYVEGNIYSGSYDAEGNVIGRRNDNTAKINTYRDYHSADYVKHPEQESSRYKLDAGDVVIQNSQVTGSIYSAGNVWLDRDALVLGDIYAAGDVYITDGSRVQGTVVAQGNVYLDNGGSIGIKDGKTELDKYLYVGGNLSTEGVTGQSPSIDVKTAYIKGNADIRHAYVRATTFIKGDVKLTFNNIYRNMYVLRDVSTGGSVTQVNKMKDGAILYAVGDLPSKHFSGTAEDLDTNARLANQIATVREADVVNTQIVDEKDKFNPILNPIKDMTFFDSEKDEINIEEGFNKWVKSEKYKDVNKDHYSKMLDFEANTTARIRPWTSPNNTTYKGTIRNTKLVDESGNEAGDNKKELIIDDNCSLGSIELTGQTLIIDTSKRNIHIIIDGNLLLKNDGDIHSKIVVRGANMAFIYLEEHDIRKDDGTIKNISDDIKYTILVEEGCSIGEVEGTNSGNIYSGLHIISVYNVDFQIGNNAIIKSFNYLPNGNLHMLLGIEGQATLTGSFAVRNVVGSTIKLMYSWAVGFKHEKSPLILDGGVNPQYGDNKDEIINFGNYDWEVVDYR